MTVSQVRWIMGEFIGQEVPDVQEIARKVTEVLQRTEEARIYHWYENTGTIPPPRPHPGPRPREPG
jgi:hypothetical protein